MNAIVIRLELHVARWGDEGERRYVRKRFADEYRARNVVLAPVIGDRNRPSRAQQPRRRAVVCVEFNIFDRQRRGVLG